MTEDEDGIKILNKNGSVIRLNRDTINRWQVDDVVQWLNNHETFTSTVIKCFQVEGIDGPVLLNLTESDINDFRYRCGYELRCGELKKLWNIINNLQLLHVENKEHHCKGRHRYNSCLCNYNCNAGNGSNGGNGVNNGANNNRTTAIATCSARYENYPLYEWDCWIPDNSSVTDGYASNIPQEYSKTAISLAYSFVVTWITSFVMVIVHERVPDMQRYPPLPDIFLDNVPHIPWAFDMCEITGTVLFGIWVIVCIFHKYRMVLLRRFFALAGTVFLLRCVTMLITSLSVPGTHLQCNKKDYAIDDTVLDFYEALYLRISRAYTIWSGLGLSIQGVRTCGDYMFSGHTVTLTLLNFFITEYTQRNLYFLHTLTWLLNMFGIFFILAAHEHYSIDVFVAFYITSRLFLYYHTLANNQALMQRDSTRTRIWFPMFSYFESSVNGIIPNEYDNLQEVAEKLLTLLMDIKDLIMLTANRVWLEAPSLPIATGSGRFLPCQESLAKLRNSATSSTNWMLLKNLSSSSTLNSERSMRGIDSSLTTIPSKIATIATETGATTLANGNTSFMMVNHTIAKAQQQQLSDNNVIACTRKYSVNDFRNQLKKSINECEDDEKTMEEIGTIIKSATTIVATTSTTAAAILSHNNNNNSNNNDAKENAIGNLILQTTQELTKKNL